VDFTDLTRQAEHTRTAAEQREADVCVCASSPRLSQRCATRSPGQSAPCTEPSRAPPPARELGAPFEPRVASDQKVPTGRLLASAGNTPTDRHRGARTRRDRERSPSSEVGLAG
jgi:hypothetical protein